MPAPVRILSSIRHTLSYLRYQTNDLNPLLSSQARVEQYETGMTFNKRSSYLIG